MSVQEGTWGDYLFELMCGRNGHHQILIGELTDMSETGSEKTALLRCACGVLGVDLVATIVAPVPVGTSVGAWVSFGGSDWRGCGIRWGEP